MADLEAAAYRGGSSEEDFMEEAGKGIAVAAISFAKRHDLPKHFVLLCGKGNNGGDAYVAGHYLLKHKSRVVAFQISSISQASPLCQKNHARFCESGGA